MKNMVPKLILISKKDYNQSIHLLLVLNKNITGLYAQFFNAQIYICTKKDELTSSLIHLSI